MSPSPTSKKSAANADSNSLDALKSAALLTDVNSIAPEEAIPSTRLLPETVEEIISKLSTDLQIPLVTCMVGTYLLLLKGAANAKAPNSMEVKVRNANDEVISLSKLDLLATYKRVTGNNFLRRLAETLAVEISQYAEKHGLKGELANKINTGILGSGGVPLNSKEMAWASSFCQCLNNLAELSSERLPSLLAADYTTRFRNTKKANSQPKSNKTKKGQGKRNTADKVAPSPTSS